MATVRRITTAANSGWTVDYTDEEGKRRRRNFPTKREAETFRYALTALPSA